MEEQLGSKWSRVTGGIQIASCCLMAFSFPFPFIYTAICVWLLALVWLLHADFRETWRQISRNYWLWTFIIYFALYAYSYTYSEDKEQSAFDITQKLSFVLLPLLLGAGTKVTRRGWEHILFAFVLGLTVIGAWCIVRALIYWQYTGDEEYLFYHQLVADLDANAVYMAWYTLFSISALLIFKWTYYFRQWWGITLKWLIIALQVLFFIMLSSRTMLVMLCGIVLPVYLYRLARRFRWSLVRILIALLFSGAIIAGLIKTDNPVKQRFEDVMHNDIQHAFQPYYVDSNQEFTNLTMRLFIWRVGVENIKKNNLLPKGAGNGDVHTLQNQRIAAYGFRMTNDRGEASALRDVDLHNMYIQTTIATGIPGLVALLLLILSPFFRMSRTGDKHLAFIFHFTACLFMLQESIFQTQSGIIYYVFFSVIFWQFFHRNRKPKQKKLVPVGEPAV
jgi:O-antigen ligase